jgi:predicted amidohydrolase
MTTTVALLQFAPQERTIPKNLAFIRKNLAPLRDAIVVLPELFLGSYGAHPLFFFDEDDLPGVLAPLVKLSRDRRLAVVGSLPVSSGGSSYNRAISIADGEIQTLYDKVLLFEDERDVFSPGEHALNVAHHGSIAFTAQICLDIYDPRPAHKAAEDGAQLVLGPACVSIEHLRTIHRVRALENQVVSVFCNRCGRDWSGAEYLGRSAIFLPDGGEHSLGSTDERLVTFELGPSTLAQMASMRRRLLVTA